MDLYNIKPVFDLIWGMTMILCLKWVLYVIALDRGTIIMIHGVGILDSEIRFVSWGHWRPLYFSEATVSNGSKTRRNKTLNGDRPNLTGWRRILLHILGGSKSAAPPEATTAKSADREDPVARGIEPCSPPKDPGNKIWELQTSTKCRKHWH
jgi:hypothetical protein